MVRRSTPQKQVDDRAFPIRIKIAAHKGGMGQLYDVVHLWLRDTIGTGNYAVHGFRGYPDDANAYYFRSIEDAARFLAAFPQLRLADGTRSPDHASPGAAGSTAHV